MEHEKDDTKELFQGKGVKKKSVTEFKRRNTKRDSLETQEKVGKPLKR